MVDVLDGVPDRLDRSGRRNVRKSQRAQVKSACSGLKGRAKRRCKKSFKKGHMAIRNLKFRMGEKPLAGIVAKLGSVASLGSSFLPGGSAIGKAFTSVGSVASGLQTERSAKNALGNVGVRGTKLESGRSLNEVLGGIVDIISPPVEPVDPSRVEPAVPKWKAYLRRGVQAVVKYWYYAIGVLILIAGLIFFKNRDKR